MSRERFWQVMFYTAMVVLAIWIILKSAGYINTPPWIEYGIPIGSFLIGLMGIYDALINKANQITTTLAVLTNRTEYLETDMGEVKSKLTIVDKKVELLGIKVEHLDKDVESIKRRLNIST